MTTTAAAVPRRRIGLAAATVFSVLVYLVVLVRPLLVASPGPLQSLRTAFWNDQLGYLSIVANAAQGEVGAVEPMTSTGVNHYPRTYYMAVGLVARALSLEPVTAWNLVSVLFQVAAVAALAVALGVLSRRWWLGALAPVPFLIGTLSVLDGEGGWSRALGSHAVLWGPYGVLFSNNAETSALCLIIVVLCALALVWLRPAGARTRLVVSIVTAALVGGLSGFQTYSFLTGVYLLAGVLAAVFLSRSRWWWTAGSLAAGVVVLVAGPLVAERAGQLATLVFGLLPIIPGLLRGAVLTRGRLVLYGAVAVAASAPPIVWTVSGIVGGDPFLAYRVGSNVDLGVVNPVTLVASAPLVLVLILLLWMALRRRDRIVAAALAGTAVVAPYLAMNDLWGANAEPYRFWINCYLLGAVVAGLALARLLATPAPQASGAGRVVRTVAAVVVSAVVALSLGDAVAFARDPAMNATWDPEAPRERAVAEAAEASGDSDGLLLTGPCVSAPTTKVGTAVPIAHYYLGMAWPADVDAVTTVMAGRDAGAVTAASLVAADVTTIAVDTACGTVLDLSSASVQLIDSFDYDDGAIELFAVAPAG